MAFVTIVPELCGACGHAHATAMAAYVVVVVVVIVIRLLYPLHSSHLHPAAGGEHSTPKINRLDVQIQEYFHN